MKKSNREYAPINCDYYDELELLALRGKSVHIVFINDVEEKEEIWGRIKTFYIQNKVEYMKMHTSDIAIRLDNIISVNGKKLHNEK